MFRVVSQQPNRDLGTGSLIGAAVLESTAKPPPKVPGNEIILNQCGEVDYHPSTISSVVERFSHIPTGPKNSSGQQPYVDKPDLRIPWSETVSGKPWVSVYNTPSAKRTHTKVCNIEIPKPDALSSNKRSVERLRRDASAACRRPQNFSNTNAPKVITDSSQIGTNRRVNVRLPLIGVCSAPLPTEHLDIGIPEGSSFLPPIRTQRPVIVPTYLERTMERVKLLKSRLAEQIPAQEEADGRIQRSIRTSSTSRTRTSTASVAPRQPLTRRQLRLKAPTVTRHVM